ncbi:anti-sigma factor domain-containing protein [Qipengyuania sp. DSG2-2]|uniref:anti-sigma factor n=1 Tax=Qipengyuania sp. DGS2-2 TaxID=3349631 RepID=UPI0036D2E114
MTDHSHLAAEYALGLLEGEDLMRARGLAASDPHFADAVNRWEEQLSPLLDEVPAATPRADLWPQIEAKLEQQAGPDAATNVVPLQQQVTRWKWATGITSAAAALALAFLAFPPGTGPAAPAGRVDPGLPLTEPDLVASIPIGETQLSIDLIYQPSARRLYVTSAGLEPDGVHDHELWLVDPTGQTRSLGVIEPGATQAVDIPLQLADAIDNGVDLVLTREPLGGAVPGAEAGPVVANGEFSTI